MGLYNPYWTKKAQGTVYTYFEQESPLSSYLNKEMEKEKPNPRKLHKVFFLKSQPPPIEERVLVAFFVRLQVL